MNKSENDEESPESSFQTTKANLTSRPGLSPELLKGLTTLPNSIEIYMKQHQQIFDNLAKATAIYEAMNLPVKLEVAKLNNIYQQLVGLYKIPNAVVEMAAKVNQSLAHLFATKKLALDEIYEQVTFQSQLWRDRLNAIDRITENIQSSDLVWRSHFIEISKYSILSQAALSKIAWDKIGDALEIKDSTRSRLQRFLLNFSKSYADLFASLDKNPSVVTSLPPIVTKLPAMEFFNGVSLTSVITIVTDVDVKFEEERQKVTEEANKDTADRLEILLEKLNPSFNTLLIGARHSLMSTNPDRVRHFAVSLRELFDHVLHALAPDDKIKRWESIPEYFDESGKPTRKARLLYICRELNEESFGPFVKKDVEALLEFLKLFQQGTHQVSSRFKDLQLNSMLIRMESTLRYLLEIWNASKII
jgi:hypothetical protein